MLKFEVVVIFASTTIAAIAVLRTFMRIGRTIALVLLIARALVFLLVWEWSLSSLAEGRWLLAVGITLWPPLRLLLSGKMLLTFIKMCVIIRSESDYCLALWYRSFKSASNRVLQKGFQKCFKRVLQEVVMLLPVRICHT